MRRALLLLLCLWVPAAVHAATLKDTTITGALTVTGVVSGDGSGLSNLGSALPLRPEASA